MSGEEWGELTQGVRSSCPYCGAEVEVIVDPGGGARQEYVEDCEICCRPWLVRLGFDGDGAAHLDLSTLDDD